MRRKHFPLILGLLIAGGTALAGSPGNVSTAEWAMDPSLHTTAGFFGGVGSTTSRGQVFAATLGGRLTRIELFVGRSEDHSVPLVVEVHAIDPDGIPSGGALASGTFAAATMPIGSVPSPVAFEFADGPLLESGVSYAITFAPETLDPESTIFFAVGAYDSSTPYEPGAGLRTYGGSGWIVDPLSDWAFRVSIDGATPVESASWGEIKERYARSSDPAFSQ